MSLKRFKIGKLIRDHVPRIFRDQGVSIHERIMDEDEFVVKLKDKLVEEAEEVQCAGSTEELTEEIADVLEVVYALAKASGLSMEQIEEARMKKRNANGGFDQKVYSEYMEMEEDHPRMSGYLARAEKYPVIEKVACKPDCLFCKILRGETDVEIVKTYPHCYAIKDRFYVSEGHLLIIPKVHVENWFAASEEVRVDMIRAVHELKADLDLQYRPDGYNIGMNCGEAAGQTVMHLHVHLIPRYRGDMENPRGGVRGVIPSKQKY